MTQEFTYSYNDDDEYYYYDDYEDYDSYSDIGDNKANNDKTQNSEIAPITNNRIGKQLFLAPPVFPVRPIASPKIPSRPSSPVKLQLKPIVTTSSLAKAKFSKQKSQQLQLNSSLKKEVNNFGFPSSFGKAGVDFPMYDPNRYKKV